MSYLLDTNICIALLKGSEKSLIKKFQQSEPSLFFLCSVVKGELYYGAHKSERVSQNILVLENFFEQFRSLAFDDAASEFYGITRALLTKAGTPIGGNDLIIASIAQTNQLTLLTRKVREFVRVPGLKCEAW